MTRPSRWQLRVPFAALLLLATLLPPAHAQDLQTPAEARAFARHSSHVEMLEYLQALQASSLHMKLSTYGTSREGRELVYAIFSKPIVTQPWEALVSGKPIVLLAANVHGGERTAREALLLLARKLVTPGSPANELLDDLVILVAPSINPDGLEAAPRPTRNNAWGIDLNRDYMKLEHPEIAHYIGNLVNRWHPHLFVDGHNGGPFPYNLTYVCTGAGAADQRLTHICDHGIFPAIQKKLEANDFLSWYYMRGNETEWVIPEEDPRIGHNYGGFANTIAILFESPGGNHQTFEEGVRAAALGYTAVVEFVQQNAQPVMNAVAEARRETVRLGLHAEGDIVIRQRYEAEDYPVDYLIGRGGRAAREIVPVTGAKLVKKPVPTHVRPRPFAYILPRDAVQAVAMLRRHNITVEVLQQPVEIEVAAYTLDGVAFRAEFNHAATTRVTVGETVTTTRQFPAGSFVIPTGQILGRVVTHLLEPETTDNVIYWSTMDALLPLGELTQPAGGGQGQVRLPALIPIYKVMRPTALPTRILENGTGVRP